VCVSVVGVCTCVGTSPHHLVHLRPLGISLGTTSWYITSFISGHLVYHVATGCSSEQLVHNLAYLRPLGTSLDKLLQLRPLGTSLDTSQRPWYISTPLGTSQTTWYITWYNQLVHHFVDLRPLGTLLGLLVQLRAVVHHFVYLRPLGTSPGRFVHLRTLRTLLGPFLSTSYISTPLGTSQYCTLGTSLCTTSWYITSFSSGHLVHHWPLSTAQSTWYIITWYISGRLVVLQTSCYNSNHLVHHLVHLRPLGTSPQDLVHLRALGTSLGTTSWCITSFISGHLVHHLATWRRALGTSLGISQVTWYISRQLGTAQTTWYITWYISEHLVHLHTTRYILVYLRLLGTSPDHLVHLRHLGTSLGTSRTTLNISTPLGTSQTTWYITCYNQLVHHFVLLRPLGTSPGHLVQIRAVST